MAKVLSFDKAIAEKEKRLALKETYTKRVTQQSSQTLIQNLIGIINTIELQETFVFTNG